MRAVIFLGNSGDLHSNQILLRLGRATIGASCCACKSILVTQSLISESSRSTSGYFFRNLMKVSVYQ